MTINRLETIKKYIFVPKKSCVFSEVETVPDFNFLFVSQIHWDDHELQTS